MLKKQIHKQYIQLVQDKIDVFQDMIISLTEDSKNDSKGSAGDKHETALSMMHLEQEKLSTKLKEAIAQKTILSSIDASQIHHKVAFGSIVKTNNLTVFISVALPKIIVDAQNIFAISPESPLGLHLLGKSVGYEFEINNVYYNINDVS